MESEVRGRPLLSIPVCSPASRLLRTSPFSLIHPLPQSRSLSGWPTCLFAVLAASLGAPQWKKGQPAAAGESVPCVVLLGVEDCGVAGYQMGREHPEPG